MFARSLACASPVRPAFLPLQPSQMLEAFPSVPWVFLFRDPVEVMVSNLKVCLLCTIVECCLQKQSAGVLIDEIDQWMVLDCPFFFT